MPFADTGGASDHVFILCMLLGFRFCPRLRDFPDRKFACIDPAVTYKDLRPLFGRRVRTDVIREHWDEVLRLVASLQAGTVLPSAMLKRLAAFQRQNQLDLALQSWGDRADPVHAGLAGVTAAPAALPRRPEQE